MNELLAARSTCKKLRVLIRQTHSACRDECEKLRAEAERLKNRPVHELREMLRSMQEGEMTVSRGIELIEMWLAGNYSDDQLPPINNDLGEDQWPMEELRKTRAGVERLRAENAAQASALVKSKNAMSSLVEWDASRNYIVPYKVRDPIHFAIAAIEALDDMKDERKAA